MRAPLQQRIKSLLTPAERAVLRRLSTPQKIQDYLDTVPINFERGGETNRSPRRVLRDNTAHCFEGALLAACALAYHGQPPLLLDFRAVPADEDHVVTPFRWRGLWGAISKTNHAVLRYRDPLYRSIRELAMSYFHEFFEWNGNKSLRSYSKPFDLSRYAPERWVIAEEELHWLTWALDHSPHVAVIPHRMRRQIRPVARLELRTMRITEWSRSGKRNA